MGKVKVLIVDDSAFMRKLISVFLVEDSRGGSHRDCQEWKRCH